MPHAKYQIPSIKIERFFQLSTGVSKEVSQEVSERTKMNSAAFAERAKAGLKIFHTNIITKFFFLNEEGFVTHFHFSNVQN